MSNYNSRTETKSKILFQLSGSIACFKACALLSKLVQAGHEVEVVASASALKFVGEATLEGLTGRKVHTDTFASGQAMDHIHLMRWADLILLCPASANTLNKFAAGIGDDLLSTMFLAHDFKKPYLIAPAMNQFMWAHPATQASISKLKSWNLQVLGTGAGNLACGEVGEGRMLEPEVIFAAIEEVLQKQENSATDSSATTKPLSFKKKILITSGGTEEPIDGVRSITNTSSGRTGAELATWFANQGHHVTLLHAKAAVVPAQELKAEPSLKLVSFTSFSTLQEKMKSLLQSEYFDVVIHLAAVADYSVSSVESNGAVYEAPLKEKIDSGEDLTLRLKKNPKLVDSIRGFSKNPEVKVVAFKLTSTNSEEVRMKAVEALAAHSHADLIVQNDATQISSQAHLFRIFERSDLKNSGVAPCDKVDGARALAEKLSDLLEGMPGGKL